MIRQKLISQEGLTKNNIKVSRVNLYSFNQFERKKIYQESWIVNDSNQLFLKILTLCHFVICHDSLTCSVTLINSKVIQTLSMSLISVYHVFS